MWNLKFISKKDLKEHIKNTIATYERTLDGIDLDKFNANILVRQRDKTNSNAIGYFHQNMFIY